MSAIACGKQEIFDFLLKNGADITRRNKSGMTCHHFAGKIKKAFQDDIHSFPFFKCRNDWKKTNEKSFERIRKRSTGSTQRDSIESGVENRVEVMQLLS